MKKAKVAAEKMDLKKCRHMEFADAVAVIEFGGSSIQNLTMYRETPTW